MNDDELRARLRAADPARRDAPAESWIDELVEATVTRNDQGQDNRTEETRSRSRWLVPAVAAAAVAAIAVGGYAVVAGDDGGGTKDDPQTELALRLPASDPMQMCIAFDVDYLKPARDGIRRNGHRGGR